MSLPRVLIFGQPFNDKYGGGITVTNLFKGWDKDRIAVAATGHLMYGVTTDVCDNYYQLGIEEFRWIFPFSLLQRKFRSGKLSFDSNKEPGNKQNKFGLRYFLVNHIFYPVLEWSGLFHCISKIKMSSRFKTWLTQFSPEILYFQVSTRDSLLFAETLIDSLRIPSAIHVMDDWPSTISRRGLFREYWRKKIDREFRHLLSKTDLCLSISHAMSEEYLRRYNKAFKPFHNPIEIDRFIGIKRETATNDKILRVLYLGRIGVANKKSIHSFSKVISDLKTDQFIITLDIFTSDTDNRFIKKISGLKNIKINPAVHYEEVPSLLKEFDLLLLPLDFTKDGLRYARYSIPTKASEYMISGTPVLVYAPGETAISKFISSNECGYCVNEQNKNKLEIELQHIINDKENREKLRNTAFKLAKRLFDATRVRSEFQNSLKEISKMD
jgi:glycosyltransferase involved in cell wall biosynthesis